MTLGRWPRRRPLIQTQIVSTDCSFVQQFWLEKVFFGSIQDLLDILYLGLLWSVDEEQARLEHAPELGPPLQGSPHLDNIHLSYSSRFFDKKNFSRFPCTNKNTKLNIITKQKPYNNIKYEYIKFLTYFLKSSRYVVGGKKIFYPNISIERFVFFDKKLHSFHLSKD